MIKFKKIWKWFATLWPALLLLFVIIVFYAHFVEPNIIKTEVKNISLDCLKNDLSGKKFVLISDLHFCDSTSDIRVGRIWNAVKNQNPDIVFLTGDLVENYGGIKPVKALVSKLAGISRVYVVFGNWDYAMLKGRVGDLSGALSSAGGHVLINQAEAIDIGKEKLNIIGLHDNSLLTNQANDLKTAINSVKGKGNGNCSILLAHSPEIINEARKQGIDLVVSGHTHGGQIYVPFLTPIMLPVSRGYRQYIAGYYENGNTKLYVSRGLGTSSIPLRFLVPPEVTVLSFSKI